MNFDNVLTNGPISDFVRERAEKTISSDELPLFVMNGDLTLRAKYGSSSLFVFRDHLAAFDETYENSCVQVQYLSLIHI